MMTLEGFARIAASEGGMLIDGSKSQPDGLARIASSAAGKGSHAVIRNVGTFALDDLARIAASGKGAVIFDLYNE